jgi:hypothetical protein
MATQMILGALALLQVAVTPPPPPPPPPVAPPPKTSAATAVLPLPRCDARPWQRLVGRTVSDLLTISLPKGTRIYRLDDPPLATITPGRLSVELNRSTRVRRVYCS